MSFRQITVAGGNLFTIASQQLGDATMAVQIAQLNGIQDPFLSGIVTLNLPAATTPSSGGIPTP